MAARKKKLPAHSKYGPSKASRWMFCHASIIEEAKYPSTSSVFAEEGSCAHRLAELCLRDAIKGLKRQPESYIGKKCDETGLEYNAEMVAAVRKYVKVCMKHYDKAAGDKIYVEEKLHCESMHPQLYGTADCIIVKANGTIVVIDFKYGKGVIVKAKENIQMMTYTAMARTELKGARDAKKYVQIIVQPRVDDPNARTTKWKYKKSRLDDFIMDLIGAIDKIERLRKATPKDGVIAKEHYAPDESRCHFCRASGQCDAQDGYNLKAMQDAFGGGDDVSFDEEFNPADPATMTRQRLAFVMQHKKAIMNWLAAVEDHAINMLRHDTASIPEFKVVEGRSNRKWKKKYAEDPEALLKKLESVFASGELEGVVVLSSLTVSQTQKHIGTMTAKQQKVFDSLWEKPPGKPTLVNVDDGRKGLVSIDDFD